MLNKTQNSGHHKLLLLGEHSILYGYPAIGFQLPWRLTLEISSQDNTFSETKEMTQNKKFWQKSSLWNSVLGKELFDPQVWEKNWRIRSDFPAHLASGGLGASAALSHTIIGTCLHDSYRSSLSSLNRAYLANQLEILFHGKPSGVDPLLSSQFGLFQCHLELSSNQSEQSFLTSTHLEDLAKRDMPKVASTDLQHTLFLLVGVVPREKKCHELIRQVHINYEYEYKSNIDILGALTKELAELISQKSDTALQKIGCVFEKAQEELNSLKLGSDLFNDLHYLARQNGALGGKLSGAGGGGAFFFLVPNQTKAFAIQDILNGHIQNDPRHKFTQKIRICRLCPGKKRDKNLDLKIL